MKKLFIILALFLLPAFASAKTDLSLAETSIALSKTAVLAGDTVRIYARVFNLGDTDVSGFVVFTNNGQELLEPRQISVRPNTYDDVFIDWLVTVGENIIQAKITGATPTDENEGNNATVEKVVTVEPPASNDRGKEDIQNTAARDRKSVV